MPISTAILSNLSTAVCIYSAGLCAQLPVCVNGLPCLRTQPQSTEFNEDLEFRWNLYDIYQWIGENLPSQVSFSWFFMFSYLWCLIVNLTIRNRPQWSLNQNTAASTWWNIFNIVVCKKAIILPRIRCANQVLLRNGGWPNPCASIIRSLYSLHKHSL